MENLKIEIDRLQRLLSSSGVDGVTIADCNIRLEKALEEYQRTPEHALVRRSKKQGEEEDEEEMQEKSSEELVRCKRKQEEARKRRNKKRE